MTKHKNVKKSGGSPTKAQRNQQSLRDKALVKRGAGKSQPKAKMHGPGPSSIRASTGKIGLSMSSGNKSGSTNRRQKICEEDEFIANVSGSATTSGFTVSNTINVNPGLLASFPWLAGEASRYDEYEFEYLEYYYKRTVSEFATAGTTGKVLLYMDPDASDVAPATKQQIEDSVYHNDGMPCDPIIRLPVDVSRLRKNIAKYVRTGPAPANTDIKTYDVGNLYVAADSTATSGVIGELRVRYRVKFTVPILTASSFTGGVVHFSSIAATTANNFAAAVQQAGATIQGITLGTNTVVFPANIPGNYLITFNFAGATSATNVAWSGSGALNLITQSAARDATNQTNSNSGTTTAPAMSINCLTVPAAGLTATLVPSTIVGTGSMDLFIVALPSTVLTVDEYEQEEIDELRRRADVQDRKIAQLMALLTPQPNSPILGASQGGLDLECLVDAQDSELSKSVHISRTIAEKLSQALSRK